MVSEITYPLGTDIDELLRLEHQHEVWKNETHQLWQRAGFKTGHHLMDLGCGPGFATLDLAKLVGPKGRVHAVDGSTLYLNYLASRLQAEKLKQVEIWCGNVYQLKVAAAQLDGVYCRFLMLFLSDHKTLLKIIAAGLKSGGSFAITDYISYYPEFKLSPPSKHFDTITAAIDRYFHKQGTNLKIQQIMPKLLTECGFEVTDMLPLMRVAHPNEPLWQWPEKFFVNFLPKLLAAGELNKTQINNFWKMWRQRSANPQAFFYTPPLLDIIAKKR